MSKRVADIVAETLAAHGIRHAFGIPGGEVITLVDALGLAGVRFILSRHETAAATMAAGASTVSNTPGLLVTTLGPGLANAVNGIADAAQEHVPLIVISGVVDHDIRGRYTHQVVDQAKLLSPLVKASFEVEATGVGATVARALAVATTHPMGPVHIDLAPGTAAQPANADDKAVKPTEHVIASLATNDTAIVDVRRALQNAERPIVIAGLYAVHDDAGSQLTELIDRFQCPIITTYKAKGIVDENNALCLGGGGLSPLADATLLPLIKSADLVLLAGYDPIEMRQPWCNPFSDEEAVIAIGPSIPDHGMFRAGRHIIGHTAQVLSAILDGATTQSPKWANGAPKMAQMALGTAFSPPGDWGPHAVFAALQNTLPANAVVSVDSGAHRILLSQMMRFKQPKKLLQSAGFCTMAAALPLAAGAKAARPEITAIAVLGDGGLEMGLGELATLRDTGLPITIVVLQDKSLALIELKQRQSGLTEAGVKLGATRFEDIAVACGGHGVRVSSVEATRHALAEAYARETFTVVVAEIEADCYVGHI